MSFQFVRRPLLLTAALAAIACLPALASSDADQFKLLDAARQGDLATVTALLKSGADVNARERKNPTALMQAASKGHLDVVRALLAAHAELEATDAEGQTALVFAVQGSHIDVVRELLAAHADPGVTTRIGGGRSVMLLAVMAGEWQIARMLLDAGANPNAATAYGETPLRVAASGSTPQQLALVRALLASHVEVDAGQWPRFKAVDARACTGVQITTVQTSRDGETLVVPAIPCNDEMRNAEGTALGIAAERGSIDIVRALLDARANVDARQIGWRTPLMTAAIKGRLDVVRALLAAGADPAASDAAGKTALVLATEAGRTAVVGLLQGAQQKGR